VLEFVSVFKNEFKAGEERREVNRAITGWPAEIMQRHACKFGEATFEFWKVCGEEKGRRNKTTYGIGGV